MKLRGLIANFYIHVSVRDLCTVFPLVVLLFAAENMTNDDGNI